MSFKAHEGGSRARRWAVDEWLKSIGLAHRIKAFRDNGLTRDQFDDLTEADLRELGLTIAERKRFIRALASHRKSTPEMPVAGTAVEDAIQADQRPLPIMFVDIVNSTALCAPLNPRHP